MDKNTGITMLIAFLFALALAKPTFAATTMRSARAGLFCSKPFTACVKIHQEPIPVPSSSQALVKLNSSSVNPSDVDTVEMGGCLLGCGNDAAGVVISCNNCTTGLMPGDHIWGLAHSSFADYVAVSEHQISLRPSASTLTAHQAGTIPEVGITSLFSLKRTNSLPNASLPLGSPWAARKNVTVVVTAGSGGTGFIGIQIAKAYGATHIITSTTGAAAIAFVTSLGATQVIDYNVADLFDSLPDDSVDFVYDNYAEEGTADKALRTIRSGGTYLMMPHGECYAKQTQGPPCLSSRAKEGVRQINYVTSVDFKAYLPQGLKELTEMFEAKQLQAHVCKSYLLNDIALGFNFSKGEGQGGVNNNHFGKIAVVMDDGVGDDL